RHVGELLTRPLGYHAPAVRMAVGVERELAALFLGVEPEQAIEFLGLRDIRHHEIEMVERMDAKLAGAARCGLGHGADLGHGQMSSAPAKICIRFGKRKCAYRRLSITSRRCNGNTC